MKTTKTPAEILATATGARASEIPFITPACISYFEDDRLYCRFNKQYTKNARTRISIVPKVFEAELMELIEGLDMDKPIVELVVNQFNAHECRRIYASELYKECSQPVEALKNKRVQLNHHHDVPAVYISRRSGKEYDREALNYVSENLDHSKYAAPQVAKNYLEDGEEKGGEN